MSDLVNPASNHQAALTEALEALRDARREWRNAHGRNREKGVLFPSRPALKRIMADLCVCLFPLRLGPPELTAANEDAYVRAALESTLGQLVAQVRLELVHVDCWPDDTATALEAERRVATFTAELPTIRRIVDSDVEAGFAADPAARSVDEVLLSYPSLTAILYYRLAHVLHTLGSHLVGRAISEVAHERTGVEIHPGARIRGRLFIDHGTGVVIGETAVIGERVRLHQGVTLGGDPALGATRGVPRHPVVGDDVVIEANASLIGRITIGRGSRIGANACLREDVPEGSLVEAPAPAIGCLGSSRAWTP